MSKRNPAQWVLYCWGLISSVIRLHIVSKFKEAEMIAPFVRALNKAIIGGLIKRWFPDKKPPPEEDKKTPE